MNTNTATIHEWCLCNKSRWNRSYLNGTPVISVCTQPTVTISQSVWSKYMNACFKTTSFMRKTWRDGGSRLNVETNINCKRVKYASCRANVSTLHWWTACGGFWNGSFSHTAHFRVIYKSIGNSCLHDVISMRTFSPTASANSNRLHKRSLRRRSKGVSSQQEQRKLLWAAMKRTYNREPQRTPPLVKKHGHQCKCPTKKMKFPIMYIHTLKHI